MKKVMALTERVEQAGEGTGIDPADSRQFVAPGVEVLRIVDPEDPVGSECRIDPCFEIGFFDFLVVLEGDVGSSVVQMTRTLKRSRMPWTQKSGSASRALAFCQISSAVDSSIKRSIPKYLFNSRCDH